MKCIGAHMLPSLSSDCRRMSWLHPRMLNSATTGFASSGRQAEPIGVDCSATSITCGYAITAQRHGARKVAIGFSISWANRWMYGRLRQQSRIDRWSSSGFRMDISADMTSTGWYNGKPGRDTPIRQRSAETYGAAAICSHLPDSASRN